jgi:hypothetical protein
MSHRRSVLLAVSLLATSLSAALGQNPVDLSEGLKVTRFVAEPARLQLTAGDSAKVKVIGYDAAGKIVMPQFRTAAPGRALQVTAINCVPGSGCELTFVALSEGVHQVTFTVVLPADATQTPQTATMNVSVTWPAIARIDIATPSKVKLYPGTTVRHTAAAFHPDKSKRPNPVFRWSSSDPAIATVDRFGNVTALRAGTVSITAQLEGASAQMRHVVPAFSATKLEIVTGSDQVKTGDVVSLALRATSTSGQQVADLPVTWSYTFAPDDSIKAPGAAGEVSAEGRFVAEVPGVYTVLASAGPLHAPRMWMSGRAKPCVRSRSLARRDSARAHCRPLGFRRKGQARLRAGRHLGR